MGVASPATFATEVVLPHNGVVWQVARLMLDAAGSLFGLYLVVAVLFSLAASVMQFRGRFAASDLRPRK
jgi:flagellar biosynthesis protein FlhB